MKPSQVLVICLVLGIHDGSAGGRLGVGIGFGRSSRPYGEALQKVKSWGISALKTWSINPEWLDAVRQVYGDVSSVS